MKANFTSDDLMFAIASFNTHPYCVETEAQAAEIMAEIDEYGMAEITGEDERLDALARLNLPTASDRTVYRAGSCIFSLPV